ncbi:hypothetical protein [Pseudolactococcus carnosus]|uniref:hypothetical protein n=1 Tax=Pseudolactococcus carnosus TaxID=2749961 RepID=UPI001FB9EC95|nr:hypothetical protein [Lactococcus carnosus]MCJ1973331.1 hypothetical protein [Lactococcus carnosus]
MMYYVTKIDDEAYLGRILFNAKSQEDYFHQAKKMIDAAFGEDAVAFVTLNALYQTLGNSDTKETILLSKYAKPYESAIATKYPSATVENYDVPEMM